MQRKAEQKVCMLKAAFMKVSAKHIYTYVYM